MKYLNELTKRKIFSYNDFVFMLGDNNLAKNTLQSYLEKGYIKRIKHNLYGVVSLETNECIADKFLIASNITVTSFVSHHSAFEFYGYYNQVYNNVNVSSNNYSLIKVTSTNIVNPELYKNGLTHNITIRNEKNLSQGIK
ncbi:MAG: hypothetical protein BHW12_02915 [Coprobacillus sp. 28_7]|nr:MAG: hypothetical protein BHW12_02915 [Coprobacillus sp. 28_7]